MLIIEEGFNDSQTVELYHIKTNKSGGYKSIGFLNQKIKEYIDSVYGRYGYRYGHNIDLDINGTIINGEYISKMVNNYTVFKSMIRINGLKDEDEFYNFMYQNLMNIYHPDGKYFKNTISIIINTSRRGNVYEKSALEFFESLLNDKGINIKVSAPTVEEDISGIDGKFEWNDRTVTIQVKPYVSTTIVGDVIKIESQGSLSLSTDYLILYNSNSHIITKAKDTTIEGKYFVANLNKVIKKPE
jgi:hypothetical protein